MLCKEKVFRRFICLSLAQLSIIVIKTIRATTVNETEQQNTYRFCQFLCEHHEVEMKTH